MMINNNSLLIHLEDVMEKLKDVYPSPNHLFGYAVLTFGDTKIQYFTLKRVEFREFIEPQKLFNEYFSYAVEIILQEDDGKGGIYAVSIDNFNAALQEISNDISNSTEDKSTIVFVHTEQMILDGDVHPFFISSIQKNKNPDISVLEDGESVESSSLEQYIKPSDETFIEISIKPLEGEEK